MRQVLVTHPGRQHSHRAALALAEGGALVGYWSGVPSHERSLEFLPGAVRRRVLRYADVPLAASATRSAPWVPGLRRLGDRLPRPLAKRIDLAACRAFDRWVRRGLERVPAGTAVLACEISALETLEAARRRGGVALLDAPSLHPAAQDRLHGTDDPPSIHRRIRAIKDREIEIADAIVTVSELARETYLEAGVAPAKVLAVPLGADLELFGAAERPERSGPCRFLFAGAPIERKGFDVLVAALERLVAAGASFHLRLVGPEGALSPLVERLPRERWSASGSLPQSGLVGELAAADCLVLPSRNDSYGMVVAEALAAGVPAIVSDMVGAAPLVREGKSGWIVPAGDVAALTARLGACAAAPEMPRAMAAACRDAASGATWEAYGERFLAALAPWLADLNGARA